jgi:NADP-dependent 3-hydroxy acid dehydrogenase YdfG
MTSTLSGTVAVVTGASSGIGAATARRLADHGARVALVARRRDRLQALAAEIEQAGGTALVVEAEVLAPEDIADGIAYMITRPRHTAIGELWIMPTDQI